MSKKQALGSIPTFNEVVRPTEKMDLFNNEEKKDKTKDVLEEVKKQVLEDAEKERNLNNRQLNRKKEQEALKKLKEAEEEQENNEEDNNEEKEKSSTKKGVRKGYKRQTFVIREDLLELIQALSSFNEAMQVDLLEAIIEAGLETIDETEKEKALTSYRKNKKTGQEKSKNNIAKLFKQERK